MSRFPLGVLACLCVSGGVVAAESTGKHPDTTDLYLEGVRLSATSAERLEEQLKEKGDEFASRLKLACYYGGHRYRSEESRAPFVRHVVWLVENAPGAKGIGNHVRLFPRIDGEEAVRKVGDLWMEQVGAREGNLEVIANAADFFMLWDCGRAEELLRKAASQERDSPRWSRNLGHLYSLGANCRRGRTEEEMRRNARKSLKEYERAQRLSEKKGDYMYLYEELAKMAYVAGENRKAAKYANRGLKNAKRGDWNDGNALFHGHTILGLLAMGRGDVRSAKEHLIKSAQHEGSPQLNSFGPDMRLGERLVEAGEKEVVLKYIDLCSKFWESGAERLKEWRELVEKGCTESREAK